MTDAFRVLVTGSRDWTDIAAVRDALLEVRRDVPDGRPITVVHGDCPSGADAMAAYLVERSLPSFLLSQDAHPAQGHPTQDFGPWPGAGPRRNAYMVSLGASLCLAFLGPCTSPRCRKPGPHPSHGASGCADLAQRARIPVRRFTS